MWPSADAMAVSLDRNMAYGVPREPPDISVICVDHNVAYGQRTELATLADNNAIADKEDDITNYYCYITTHQVMLHESDTWGLQALKLLYDE